MQTERLQALRVLREYGLIEEYELPDGLVDDERFMLLAIGMNSARIHEIGKELFKNREFIQMVLAAYEERWVEARNPTDDLEEFDPFIQGQLTPLYANIIYKGIPDELKADPFMMGELVKRKLKITELHDSLSGNSEFLIKAFEDDADMFQLADGSLQNDVDFVRLAVKTNPSIWTSLSDEQKTDPEMMEALTDIKTHIYEKISLWEDEELENYGQLLPIEIREDKEFAILFLPRNYRYLRHLSDSLKDDLEVIKAAYECETRWGFNEAEISDNASPRIKSLLEKSNLDPVATLTNAIASEKLHGKLGVDLKPKEEAKLTPRQRKQQSGPVL